MELFQLYVLGSVLLLVALLIKLFIRSIAPLLYIFQTNNELRLVKRFNKELGDDPEGKKIDTRIYHKLLNTCYDTLNLQVYCIYLDCFNGFIFYNFVWIGILITDAIAKVLTF